MQITWYGHAAFRLAGRNADGETVRVVLDPYRAPDAGTYEPIDDEAEVVAVSHENERYHSHVAAVSGPGGTAPAFVDGLALLNEAQPQTVAGLPFTATRVWETPERTGEIAMVAVEIEGVRVLHMGDCGHGLSPEDVAACGRVDVLLALAGGKPTLALPDLRDFVLALKPRVVLPMHYGNDKINLNLRPVEEFLAMLPETLVTRHLATSTVTVTADTLPAATEVWLLHPAR